MVFEQVTRTRQNLNLNLGEQLSPLLSLPYQHHQHHQQHFQPFKTEHEQIQPQILSKKIQFHNLFGTMEERRQVGYSYQQVPLSSLCTMVIPTMGFLRPILSFPCQDDVLCNDWHNFYLLLYHHNHKSWSYGEKFYQLLMTFGIRCLTYLILNLKL